MRNRDASPAGEGYTGCRMKRLFRKLRSLLHGKETGIIRELSAARTRLPARVRLSGTGLAELHWIFDGETVAGEAPFFYSPGSGAMEMEAEWLEAALLILAVENLDAVYLADAVVGSAPRLPRVFAELLEEPWRGLCLFAAKSLREKDGRIIPTGGSSAPLVAKLIDAGGLRGGHDAGPGETGLRRGPYLLDRSPGPRLKITLSDPLPLSWPERSFERPGLLITVPFLARGGAEHTLYETMKLLRAEFRLHFLTLAEHRPELDDRRPDFRRLSPQLLSLGDWLHPDAMPAILEDFIARQKISTWYNANGSTLFYEFGPRIRARFPDLRIVDHLYDHRVGYIRSFEDPATRDWIDAVVAENHLIARELGGTYGWSTDRVPVVWPCGRAEEELPPAASRQETRNRLRTELKIDPEACLFLTAARMHPQKRPLDLVRLAAAAPPHCVFLIVGGGPMEEQVDRAIAESGLDNIRRLPFRRDIPDLILAADVGLLVSAFEGLPVFALECLQLGVPFIGTRAGDLEMLLEKTNAGICSGEPGDIGALADAVGVMRDDAARKVFAERAFRAGREASPARCAREMRSVLEGGSR